MKKVKIALYDQEGYTQHLAEYMCRKNYKIFETRLFTSMEGLKKYLEKNTIDVLLIGEEVVSELSEAMHCICECILLSAGNFVAEGSRYDTIFKYQSAEQIVKELLSLIAEDDSISFIAPDISKKAGEIIGVYAPYGGAGVTSIALRMGKELAKEGKVLYISLELFGGISFTEEGKKQEKMTTLRGMSEVIFYLKQGKEKLAIKLASLIQQKGELDCIAAVEDYRDLYQITAGEMKVLLQVLLEETCYEKIVFDIGYLSDATLYLLQCANRVYMPAGKGEMQKNKQEGFFKLLQRENLLELRSQIQFVEE